MKKVILLFFLITPFWFLTDTTLASTLENSTIMQEVGYTMEPLINEIVDHDANTFFNHPKAKSGVIKINLNDPIDLIGFYMKYRLKTGGSYNTASLIIHYGDGLSYYLVANATTNRDGYYSTSRKYENVTAITISLLEEVDLYEVALNGTPVESQPVKNVETTATENSVSLTWDLPTLKTFSHIEVNGENIGKATNYTQNGLDSLTNYNYEIKSFFTNGKNKVVNTTVQTLRDDTPPKTVTNLKLIENESNKVDLTYVFPADKDFTHVAILRDDVVIAANVKANNFTDNAALEAGKEYKYSVIAYDKSGNASTVTSAKIKMRPKAMKPITNLKLEQSGQNVVITFDFPVDDTFSHVRIWRDNQSIVATLKNNTHTDLTKLLYNREYTYKVVAYDKNMNPSPEVAAKITLVEKYVEPISNLKITQVNERNADLTYTLPTSADFDHVKIYRNGMLIENNYKSEKYEDRTALAYNVDYTYKIVAYDKMNMPSKETVGKVKIQSRDITNLKASATYDSVSLSWSLPSAEKFEKVIIYRQDEKIPLLKKVVAFFMGGTEAALFETNGTTFKDLTVESDTSYIYRITSMYEAKETDGVKITVKTSKVSASGGGTEVTPSGDYLVTWDKPETGQMKVLVGGKEYAIVPASDKQIIIPKSDMVYDLIGKTDVKLVPISDDGSEGIPSSPGGVGGGGGMGEIIGGGEAAKELTASNVLKAGVSLVSIVGAFILLGLAFKMSPRIMQLIRSALSARKAAE